MDYIDAFKNLKTSYKSSKKSPHKAILLLSIIEMYEKNVLSTNMIPYDDTLKGYFQKVWKKVLNDDTIFHVDISSPFWYMESEPFWHIVPYRGKEDILKLLRDVNVKPSETKLKDCVNYVELDEDLFFLMTLPSGRSSLKRALLETYTNLPEEKVKWYSISLDNSIDYFTSAISDYEMIVSKGKDGNRTKKVGGDNELLDQFQKLNEDVRIVLNLQYYSFLKSHRNEREMFKEVCPSVLDMFDMIANHPIKQGDVTPSFAFIYDNFLSDLKISLMNEEGSIELIDKISEAIDLLRGNYQVNECVESKELSIKDEQKDRNVEQVDTLAFDKDTSLPNIIPERNFSKEDRKGKPWTKVEEEQIVKYFQKGLDIATIAGVIGRTDVAIKARLVKLGIIRSINSQEDESISNIEKTSQDKTKEGDFTIENSSTSCSILNKYGGRIFSSKGKLKYLQGKLYRLNLKNECFTMKIMRFNGIEWQKGEKKIVAYPMTELYCVLNRAINYCDEVEDIVDDPIFEKCRLKVKDVWYSYDGHLIADVSMKNVEQDDNPLQNSDIPEIAKSPLYAVRKQAILRAMGFFRIPAKIRDIVRTISRTAWGAVIKEKDVEEIIGTLSEVESVEGKYILRKKK